MLSTYSAVSTNTSPTNIQPIQKPYEELDILDAAWEGLNILRKKPTLRTPPKPEYQTTTDLDKALGTLREIDRKDGKIVRETVISGLVSFSALVLVMAASWHRKDEDPNGANIIMLSSGFLSWGIYTFNLFKNLETELNTNRNARHTTEGEYDKGLSALTDTTELDVALKTAGDAQKTVVLTWDRVKQTQHETINQLRQKIDEKDQEIFSSVQENRALERRLNAMQPQTPLYEGMS